MSVSILAERRIPYLSQSIRLRIGSVDMESVKGCCLTIPNTDIDRELWVFIEFEVTYYC
jgi:hypothetical protein